MPRAEYKANISLLPSIALNEYFTITGAILQAFYRRFAPFEPIPDKIPESYRVT